MEAAYPLGLIVAALIVGAAMREIGARFRIPYTVLLLLVGVAVGGAVRLGLLDALPELAAVLTKVRTVDPRLVLFVFLPTLVFESAFGLDVHLFRQVVGPATILAVPGLLFATTLTAVGAHLLLDWSWPVAWLFGALISATDPVAVVALLREIGAGKRLAALIESESLLNDGTAIVLFGLFWGWAVGSGLGAPVAAIGSFAWIVAGGVLIGGAVALLAVRWLGRIANDALIEITITLATAYLAFLVAEAGLHVSGVLAVVAAGLLFAGIGRTRISPAVAGFLHRFWEVAAYLANTLIFLWVGLLVVLLPRWRAGLWLDAVVLFGYLVLVRALVVGASWPLLVHLLSRLRPAEGVVLIWGALRGAVGLALALMAVGASQLGAVGEELLAVTAVVVAGTLVGQGASMRWLLRRLGLDRRPPAVAAGELEARLRLVRLQRELMGALRHDPLFAHADWRTVERYLAGTAVVPEEIPVEETPVRLLWAERCAYWAAFSAGHLGAGALRLLLESVATALDREGDVDRVTELSGWIRWPWWYRWGRRLGVSRWLLRPLSGRVALVVDALRGFVAARDRLLEVWTPSTDEVPERGTVVARLRAERAHAQALLIGLADTWPEIVEVVTTKAVVRVAIVRARKEVGAALREGRLDEATAHRLEAELDGALRRLFTDPPHPRPRAPQRWLAGHPWLAEVSIEVIDALVAHGELVVCEPGERIVTEGATDRDLYLVLAGGVQVWRACEDERLTLDLLGPGRIFGELALLTGAPRSANVEALRGGARLLRLAATAADRIPGWHEVLEPRLWEIAAVRLAENAVDRAQPWGGWPRDRLRRWLAQGNLLRFDPEVEVAIGAPCFVVWGTVEQATGERLVGPVWAPKGLSGRTLDAVRVLCLPPI